MAASVIGWVHHCTDTTLRCVIAAFSARRFPNCLGFGNNYWRTAKALTNQVTNATQGCNCPRLTDVPRHRVTDGIDRIARTDRVPRLPDWLPRCGAPLSRSYRRRPSLRALARREGLHASTVMRQVRRYREPPRRSADGRGACRACRRSAVPQTPMPQPERTTRRCLPRSAPRRLVDWMKPRSAREGAPHPAPPGRTGRRAGHRARYGKGRGDARISRWAQRRAPAVVDRAVAQAFALKDWITCRKPGRVATYEITAAGRAALKRHDGRGRPPPQGMAEAADALCRPAPRSGASAR